MDPIDYDNEEIIEEEEFSDEEENVDKVQSSKPKKKGEITIRSEEDADEDASDVASDDESIVINNQTLNESDDDFEEDEEIDDEEIENKIFSKEKDEVNEEDEELNPFHEDDFSDEEEKDSDYLQKIDDNYKENLISNYHPELHNINYDEVESLAKVIRDEDGNIIDPLHRTQPFITKYEKARIIGERAKQVNAGSKPFISVDENVIDGYLIALKEFEERKLPFIVKRPLPNGGCEYWKLQDLEVIS